MIEIKQRNYDNNSILESIFKLTEKGTDIKTEILAGATTFIATAYILAVIPSMLCEAGMEKNSTVAAVVLITAFATIFMGMFANLPVVVAPGLGLSAFLHIQFVEQCS